jgi:hypothetical protein
MINHEKKLYVCLFRGSRDSSIIEKQASEHKEIFMYIKAHEMLYVQIKHNDLCM